MRRLLLSCALLAVAGGAAYGWHLYASYAEHTAAFATLGGVPGTPAARKVRRIRQLHAVLDDYRMHLPAGSSDAGISAFGTRLQGYADVMSARSVDRAVGMLLSERRSSAHRYGVALYARVLERIGTGDSVIRKPAEIAQLYKDCIWLAKCHGHGLSDGVSPDEVVRWLREGQAYCWGSIKQQVSWFTFECAIFTAQYIGPEEALATLERGLAYIGYDDDRDGSVMHEYGMALMRQYHRNDDLELLLKASAQFDRAIELKVRAGNDVTPLYSRKMRLEALSEYYFTRKMQREFLALKDEHLLLVQAWEAMVGRLDAGGLRALHEVYMACGLCLLYNKERDAGIGFVIKAKAAAERYDPANRKRIDGYASFLSKLQPEGEVR